MTTSDRADGGRFRRDVAWNVASIAVLGVSGIALNAIIARTYDAAALGVFNQVMAAYILFSQLAVGGVRERRGEEAPGDDRAHHEGAEEFVMAKAMASSLGLCVQRFLAARALLEKTGSIRCLRRGGKGKNTPPIFGWP
jgi:hypothetical protein